MMIKNKIIYCILLSVAFASCKEEVIPMVVDPPVKDTVKIEFVKRSFYNAKLEPVNGVLHGAGQDFYSFTNYSKALDATAQPIIYMSYIELNSSMTNILSWGNDLRSIMQELHTDVRVQLGINFKGLNGQGQRIDSLSANGKYDQQLDTIVSVLKSLNRPVYVRIGYEFEGSWNGYMPEYYIPFFIKATTKLRDKNVNAATIWCAAGGSAGFKPINTLLSFYPGDEWVDWWSIDVFSASEITDPNLKIFFRTADQHKKPIMIGETTPRFVGVMQGQISWDLWFKPFFNMIYQSPQVKAFCYINWDWAYWAEKYNEPTWANWGEARIEKNNYVNASYNDEMKKTLFVHQK